MGSLQRNQPTADRVVCVTTTTRSPTTFGYTERIPVHPDVVGRAGLSQPAAHWMQNIMLRRRAGTDAPYLHHRQHRDARNAFVPQDRALN